MELFTSEIKRAFNTRECGGISDYGRVVMEHFISLLFLARDVAHREHLRTRSFAAHMALNDFYHEIIEQADGLVEAYQGSYLLLKDLEIIGSKNVDNIEDFLRRL
jgi:hypothetical protein